MVQKNMVRKIKGVIFDLGGVLIDDADDALIRNACEALCVSRKELKRATRNEFALVQTGCETSLQFWHRICKKLNMAPPANRKLSSIFVKSYIQNTRINKKLLSVIRKLHKTYPLGMISNTVKEHTMINKKRNIFKNFDVVILSHKVGLRKPQEAIYSLAAEKLHLPPQNLLHIDNELACVRAARVVGMQAILYKNYTQLMARLRELSALNNM